MNAETQHAPGNIGSQAIRFPLGHLVATPGALELLDRMAVNGFELVCVIAWDRQSFHLIDRNHQPKAI